jgi:hypothetical protein
VIVCPPVSATELAQLQGGQGRRLPGVKQARTFVHPVICLWPDDLKLVVKLQSLFLSARWFAAFDVTLSSHSVRHELTIVDLTPLHVGSPTWRQ